MLKHRCAVSEVGWGWKSVSNLWDTSMLHILLRGSGLWGFGFHSFLLLRSNEVLWINHLISQCLLSSSSARVIFPSCAWGVEDHFKMVQLLSGRGGGVMYHCISCSSAFPPLLLTARRKGVCHKEWKLSLGDICFPDFRFFFSPRRNVFAQYHCYLALCNTQMCHKFLRGGRSLFGVTTASAGAGAARKG